MTLQIISRTVSMRLMSLLPPINLRSIFLAVALSGLYCQFPPVESEPLQGKIQLEESMPMSGDVSAEEQGRMLSGKGLLDDLERRLSGHTSEQQGLTMPANLSFSEKVDPVPQDLKVHKLFSSIELPAEDKEDLWYQIPKWRAGLFHRDKQIDHTLSGDYESVSKVDHLYGMQLDRRGGVWHHVSWPAITKLTLDGYCQYKMISRYEPVKLSEKEFTVKVYSTNVDVDDKTGKIIRVAKQEEFDRYFPAGPGAARGECLIQGFSARGNQNTTVERCSVEESQIQPFKVLNTFRGKNLRESFKKFLQSHGLAELAPE